MGCYWTQLIVDSYKDLGILFDTGLKFHQHTSETVMKANRVLACMRRGLINLNESVLLHIQVNGLTYIRIWKCDMGTALCIRST